MVRVIQNHSAAGADHLLHIAPGNDRHGVFFQTTTSNGVSVEGNVIGLKQGGSAALLEQKTAEVRDLLVRHGAVAADH